MAHPLLLTPVLNTLSEALEFKELAIGRLVCKSWYIHLSPKFASRSKFILHSNDDKKDRLPELIYLLENTGIFFITSLTLYLDQITDQIQQLLNVCQGKITQLQILERYEDMTITFDQFRNILQNAEKLSLLRICLPETSPAPIGKIFEDKSGNLSNLRTIELIGYASPKSDFLSLPPATLHPIFKELFDAASLLEEIVINVKYSGSAVPVLSALKDANKFQSLRSLRICGTVSIYTCTELVLAERGLRLKCLYLDVGSLELDETGRTCLKQLLLKLGPLTELHLTTVPNYGEHSALEAVLAMSAVTSVPKLRLVPQSEAAMCRFVGGMHPIQFVKGCRGWTVEKSGDGKISIDIPYPGTDRSLLQGMKNAYPGTASLSVSCSDDCLPIICAWTELQHLRITYLGDKLSQGLLGFTRESLEKIEKKKLYKDLKKVRNIPREGPVITGLTGLKTLRIATDKDLTVLVYMGLVKMTWLEQLTLGERNVPKEARKFLTTNLSTTKVIFESSQSLYR